MISLFSFNINLNRYTIDLNRIIYIELVDYTDTHKINYAACIKIYYNTAEKYQSIGFDNIDTANNIYQSLIDKWQELKEYKSKNKHL